ncbi:hypothetical protein [Brevundimonas sp. SPF441]|uniref:hypothetical protein n=1 Tax=Brevundimonas sp. SPF441 TaxID=2663795 RepID=UPI00129E2671|nr:hypothetical protein [Brevundimonas sp. SPF441]MRL69871.1 hypothetical protein [Brevundimonas sp. SPF441]
MKKLVIAAALVSSLSACVTAPAVIPIENSRAIPLTKNEVWANLVEYFATSNIAIKTIEKDSGIIYAERMFARGNDLGGYADCGAAALAAPVGGAADLNVFVRETATGVNATVNARYRQSRMSAWDGSVGSTECASLGTLERSILDAAGKR